MVIKTDNDPSPSRLVPIYQSNSHTLGHMMYDWAHGHIYIYQTLI